MPDEKSVMDARMVDDPLLLLISHDGNLVIMGNIDFLWRTYFIVKKCWMGRIKY